MTTPFRSWAFASHKIYAQIYWLKRLSGIDDHPPLLHCQCPCDLRGHTAVEVVLDSETN